MQIRSLTGSLHLNDPESPPPPRFFSESPLVLPPQPLPLLFGSVLARKEDRACSPWQLASGSPLSDGDTR